MQIGLLAAEAGTFDELRQPLDGTQAGLLVVQGHAGQGGLDALLGRRGRLVGGRHGHESRQLRAACPGRNPLGDARSAPLPGGEVRQCVEHQLPTVDRRRLVVHRADLGDRGQEFVRRPDRSGVRSALALPGSVGGRAGRAVSGHGPRNRFGEAREAGNRFGAQSRRRGDRAATVGIGRRRRSV